MEVLKGSAQGTTNTGEQIVGLLFLAYLSHLWCCTAQQQARKNQEESTLEATKKTVYGVRLEKGYTEADNVEK